MQFSTHHLIVTEIPSPWPRSPSVGYCIVHRVVKWRVYYDTARTGFCIHNLSCYISRVTQTLIIVYRQAGRLVHMPSKSHSLLTARVHSTRNSVDTTTQLPPSLWYRNLMSSYSWITLTGVMWWYFFSFVVVLVLFLKLSIYYIIYFPLAQPFQCIFIFV